MNLDRGGDNSQPHVPKKPPQGKQKDVVDLSKPPHELRSCEDGDGSKKSGGSRSKKDKSLSHHKDTRNLTNDL